MESYCGSCTNGYQQSSNLEKKMERAQAIIALSVEDSQLVQIREQETALGTWNALKEAHELDTVTNRISLYKQIASLKMKESDNIEKHLNEFTSLFQKLSDLGATADPEWKIGMFFSSLPSSYSTLITALEARKSEELTWSLIHTKVLDESIRRKQDEKEGNEGDKLMKIGKSTTATCQFCNRSNHNSKDCYHFKRNLQFQEFEMRNQKFKSKANEITESYDSDNSERDEENHVFFSIVGKSDYNQYKKQYKIVETLKELNHFKIPIIASSEKKIQKLNQLSEHFDYLNSINVNFNNATKSTILLNSISIFFN